MLPNISREVKAKYLGMAVKVSGNVNDKYRAIMVDAFEIKDGATFKTVWSAKMMREEMMKRLQEYYPEH